jgi:putative transposase
MLRFLRKTAVRWFPPECASDPGMARRRRLRIAGVSHHVIQRGNNRTQIFLGHDDYERFITILRGAASRHRVEIHGYVLMSNHVHLLTTSRTPTGIEKTMHSVGFQYARYFNDHHQRTGALYEGRYRATIIDNEAYWFRCLRYVELNPVRAGLVSGPELYYWSSYAANALGSSDALVTPHAKYLELGRTAQERQRSWRKICAISMSAEELGELRAAVHRGDALGRIILPCD